MRIEDFLKDNEINTEDPNIENLWNEMEAKRNSKKNKKIRFTKYAAAILLMGVVIGALIRFELKMDKQITNLSQINKEIGKIEQDYAKQIQVKWTKYSEMTGNDSEMTPFLLNELKILDTIYQEGLQNLKNRTPEERKILLLLNTYEKRLRIIEQLIYEKEKQANYENKIKKMDI